MTRSSPVSRSRTGVLTIGAAALVLVGWLAGGCRTDTEVEEQVADTPAAAEDRVQIEVLEAEDTPEVAVPAAEDATVDQPESARHSADEPDQAGHDDPDSRDSSNLGIEAPFTIVATATVSSLVARDTPSPDGTELAAFSNPIASGAPLVFRAVAQGGETSPEWIEVLLPVKPNGTTGWIRRDEVSLSDNPFRVEIVRADYSLRVFNRNSLWVETTIAVGNGATPTPVGEYYLMELLAPPDPTGPYGPYAFGLSGFSEVLDSFGGADTAVIGLHGTNDPGSLGSEVSHGCIRLENSIIEALATTLPLGTPVKIT